MRPDDDHPADGDLMRIKEAAAAAGVSRQTVQYYIMLGLIEPIRGSNSHNRHFDDKLVRRIRLIHQLNRSGYALRDIRDTYFHSR